MLMPLDCKWQDYRIGRVSVM